MITFDLSDMTKAYIGSTEVSKVYLGSDLVWDSNGGTPSLLPTGYTQLDWIQNTSDARIDTGIKGTASTSFKIRVRVDDLANTNGIFGARNSTTASCLAVNNTSSKFRFGFYRTSTTSNVAITQGQWYDIELNTRKFYVDGVQVDSRSSASFTTPYNLHLFTIAGTNSGNLTYYDGRCSMGISYVNDRVYVPCIEPNGVVGMYETTYGKFYSSTNSTAFVAGDVTIV